MTSNGTPALKMGTAFATEYAAELRMWGSRLAEGSGPIVAISRKAPRVLELGVREGLIPDSILNRVTSERGLHAMQAPNREPLKVCDDIVIVGSTFKRVGDIARELCGSNQVVGLPFARCTAADAQNLDFVREAAPVALSEDICSSFVLSEVAAFGFLDKPYDVEHPILYLDLESRATPEGVGRSLKGWAEQNGCGFYETPRQLADAGEQRVTHSAWTILLPRESESSSGGRIRKIRCYMNAPQSRLALVPIETRAGTLQEFEDSVRTLPTPLVDCWKSVNFSINEAESALSLTNRNRSALAWAAYLLDLDALGSTLCRLRLRLLEDALLAAPHTFYLDIFDIQLLTGVGSGEGIKTRVESFVNSVRFGADPAGEKATPWNVTAVIPEEYRIGYETALADLLEGVADPAEAMEAVFKAQHIGIELQSRANEPRNPRRLEFGVPLGYLGDTVESALGAGQDLDFHRALDSLIDSGVIVPRYLPQQLDGREVWCRTFRVGEALSIVRGHVAKECFKALSGVHHATELREVLTEKFLVLVCDLDGLFESPSLASTPEIRRHFHLYGARPSVVAGGRREWFVDWATRRRILHRVEREGEPMYSLDSRVRQYFRDDENPLTNGMRHRLAALARWTRAANEAEGLGGDFLVAITTVESMWAYRQAIEAEMSGWINHEMWGIAAALHALDDCVAEVSPKTKAHARSVLGHLANWIAQAKVKHALREALPMFIARADSVWAAESYEETATTWRNIIRAKWQQHSTRECQPRNIVIETLSPTVQVLSRFTSLLRNILSEFAGVTDERAISAKDSARKLVEAIETLPSHIRDNFKEAIAGIEAVTEAKDFGSAVSAIRKPASVIGDAAESVLSLYPDLSDEPIDPLRTGLFVLLWDVRGSANNETREELTRRIIEVNRSIQSSFRRRLIHFDAESTDDGNAAVCQDFETAISVAKAVVAGFAPFTVKMGCDTNADGMLCRGRSSKRLSGRAFEYAARMMAFFTEIKSPSQSWVPDLDRATRQPIAIPTEPPGVSYLLLSEKAHRLAVDGEYATLAQFFTRLLGSYRPRVYGAFRQDVYLRSFDPRSAAIQMSLLSES
jgi:hypothetical protein